MNAILADSDFRAARNVLVVDDEADLRRLLRNWLENAGYQCLMAADVESAISRLTDSRIDVVVTDIHMPRQDGFDLLRWIRDSFHSIPVIMLTGSRDVVSAVHAFTDGAVSYLLKPPLREELIDHIERAIDRRLAQLRVLEHTRELESRLQRGTLRVKIAQEETVERLVLASACRDEETGAHMRRTGLYSEVVAKRLGWSREELDCLRRAAPMHDLGKIGIPDRILQKPAPLLPEEMETMRQHTVIGARLLDGSASPILQFAHDIALSHHEHWDGSGYPYGLCGYQIPECGRIVALADVYDALTHRRVYRPGLSEDVALRIMDSDSGKHFDPHLFEVFLESLPSIREIAECVRDEDAPARSNRHSSTIV